MTASPDAKVSAERRNRLGVVTFDDQLVRLRDTLADPVTGESSCQSRAKAGFTY